MVGGIRIKWGDNDIHAKQENVLGFRVHLSNKDIEISNHKYSHFCQLFADNLQLIVLYHILQ